MVATYPTGHTTPLYQDPQTFPISQHVYVASTRCRCYKSGRWLHSLKCEATWNKALMDSCKFEEPSPELWKMNLESKIMIVDDLGLRYLCNFTMKFTSKYDSSWATAGKVRSHHSHHDAFRSIQFLPPCSALRFTASWTVTRGRHDVASLFSAAESREVPVVCQRRQRKWVDVVDAGWKTPGKLR